MAAPDPYADLADPVAAPQSGADPYAQIAEPVPDHAAPATPEQPVSGGFTDDQKQQILAYLPKAKDAADLERFSSELTQGRSKIGNAQAVLEKRDQGHKQFVWTPPTSAAQTKAPEPSVAEHLRNAVGDSILNTLDTFVPGLGSVLRQNQDAGKAFTEHAANAVAMDYGPEVGGVIDTILHGDTVGRNAAHERAILEGDSEGHPIASIVGELGGTAATALLGNEAGVANLGRVGRGAVTATESGAYGSGAAGPDHRVEGAITGAALGTATEAAAPFVSKFLAATKAGNAAEAAKVAQAAHDLGIDLPRFVIGGERDARRASALEQTISGSKPISDATSRMLDQAEAARSGIASAVGNAAEPAAMGEQALSGAISGVKSERARIGKIYDQARTAAGGTIFEASQTEKTLQQLADQEGQVLGGTKAGTVFQSLLDDLKNRQGKLTIDGARDTRTELRTRLRDEAGVTPDNADRLTNMVMGSINSDIESGLADTGNTGAIPFYRKADAQWAKQRTLEDEVLKPFLGRNFDNWGEEVASKINSGAKGNGTRLAQFLNAIPQDEANGVRASLIMRLGSSANGVQNAAGDAFSLDTFLTNWNQIKGARNLILPKESVESLDKLAQVAQAVKTAGRTKNRSNTGSVMSYLVSGAPLTGGAAETLMTGDPKGVALGMLFSGLNTVRQYGAAKLLASPAFAKKLASTPLNPVGAKAFWSRPWVQALAVKNPAIAGEIQAFQHAFLSHANDNSGVVTAASADPNEENQQQ